MQYPMMRNDCENGPFHSSINEYETIITLKPGISETQIDNWSSYLPCLEHTFHIERMKNGNLKKLTVSEDVVAFLGDWLSSYSRKINKNFDKSDLVKLINIVRSLRNATSTFNIQNFILLNTNILDDLKILFEVINLELPNDFLKFILQFLYNITSSNAEATRIVHEKFKPYIELCFAKKIHIYESSALLYNISLIITISDDNIFQEVLNALKEDNHSEFLYFFIENQVSLPHFSNIYETLLMDGRLIVLELIKHLQVQKGVIDLHENTLNIFIHILVNSANIIFQTEIVDNIEIKQVSLLLEIISSMSSNTKCFDKFRSNRDLLINVGVLLINIHRLCKDSQDCFTPVPNLALDYCDGHPAFGFKGDLIRLIGNMCWQNAEMQDLVRTAELIPIILDCCNIDDRNPFIMQWSILAVRNICEKNLDNQRIIAGLYRNGVISNDKLKELGITLHSDQDKSLGIISLDALREK